MSDYYTPLSNGVFEGTAWPRPAPTKKADSDTAPEPPHLADWTRDEVRISSTYVAPGFHR